MICGHLLAATAPQLLPQQPSRQVEARTRQEIEEKKQQLRHVVGDSYRCAHGRTCLGDCCRAVRTLLSALCRDLISSADTIVDISRSCHRVVEVISSLQCGLADVAAGVGPSRGAPHETASTSYDRLYGEHWLPEAVNEVIQSRSISALLMTLCLLPNSIGQPCEAVGRRTRGHLWLAGRT